MKSFDVTPKERNPGELGQSTWDNISNNEIKSGVLIMKHSKYYIFTYLL